MYFVTYFWAFVGIPEAWQLWRWKNSKRLKKHFKSLTNTVLGLSLGSLWLWGRYTVTPCPSAAIQRNQAQVMCIALLLSSQAELCLCQLISLVSPCQAGLCTALGTMPREKFRRSYPVCAGKCKRALLWEQAGLCDEIWPLSWFISQFKQTDFTPNIWNTLYFQNLLS